MAADPTSTPLTPPPIELEDNITTTTTTTLAPVDVFLNTVGTLFDFREMSIVDWDEVHDGDKVAPRAYTSWNALNITRLALATWILASHLAIVVFLLAKHVLRTQPKNLLIVNVALANILMGAFVVPVKLHFILHPDHADCDLAVGWMFISDYFQSSLSLFAVFCLVLERFVYVYTEKKQKNILPLARTIGTVILMLVPWVFSLIILLPTFLSGLLAKSTKSDSCLFKVDDSFFLACQLLAFIPASFGVFIFAPFTGLLDCLRPKRCFYRPLTPRGESSTVTTIVTLFSIFCEAPYCIVRVLMMRMECNSPDCTRLAEGLTLTMWLRISKAAVFPFIWLAYTDIRDAMKCKFDLDAVCGDDDDFGDDDDDRKLEDTDPGYPLTVRRA
ncbi:uncharacterized protein LOC101860676 [Aplysia californica]|uniref:Uncharacterized protein LOC101860676 n=1 Tax=Aplysia californica TaxID=6500 RepID=A0ABM0JZ30_APLCA|nr:uncharacterized protein LOC101860676 [Aplysia californica]